MGLEQSAEAVRAALIKAISGKSYLRPSGLIESIALATGETRLSVQQSLARLARDQWITGVSHHGEPIAQVKIVGDVPLAPSNPDLDRWLELLARMGLNPLDRSALQPLYKALAPFDAALQEMVLNGLLRLRENLSREVGRHRFVVSARYLLGSSKLLDALPGPALKAFGVPVERFPGHPLYVVAGGCANPETVILVENPAAFELALATGAATRCAFIATFGFGLSKADDDYGRQLAGLVEERFAGAITLVREASACPTAKTLLNHPNITFWGDLDPAGIEIFQRLRRALPKLHFSALYLPMLEATQSMSGAHPYVSAVGKPGQQGRYLTVRCEDTVAETMLARCSARGVDQESVPPEMIENLAPHQLDPDAI